MKISFNNLAISESDMPDDMRFSLEKILIVVCNSIGLTVSALGNLIMLAILARNLRRQADNRIFILLLHLNIADLIVTFFYMPKVRPIDTIYFNLEESITMQIKYRKYLKIWKHLFIDFQEIIHASTVQWLGPDWLCRVTRYMDVFGIYVSSNVLISMSIDRFFAIVKPMSYFKAKSRVKHMLLVAWLLAALSSVPQVRKLLKVPIIL